MRYDAILFDLDGTLLPMDNEVFTKGYLKMLSKAVSHLGFTPETLIPTMWKGVAAMVKNEGQKTNFDVFWETFSKAFDWDVIAQIPVFDAFYSGEFHKAKQFSCPTPLARKAVELARKKANKVILATNPFFPKVAVDSRLEWAGLSPDDFDLITTYENSSSCKPNPYYYKEIAQNANIDLKESLMVGNNVEEDIKAAEAAGLKTFLLTDCIISESDELPECPKGDFNALLGFLGEE